MVGNLHVTERLGRPEGAPCHEKLGRRVPLTVHLFPSDTSAVLIVTLWAIAALALLIAEILSGTFILLFFAIAATLTALAALSGLAALHWQLVLFAVVGVTLLLLFRKKLLARSGHGKHPAPVDVGGIVTCESEIAPGTEGVAAYQGAPWTVKNVGEAPIARGQRARIVRTEGVRLFVEAIH